MTGDDLDQVLDALDTRIDMLRLLHQETRVPPPELVATLKKQWTRDDGSTGYVELDYLGHADVTEILLNHDPLWNWEPAALDERGLPKLLTQDGHPVGLWIKLTILGVTRLGYGSCQPGKHDAVKELIGDAIRNAAMRFGIGLALWSKAEWAG